MRVLFKERGVDEIQHFGRRIIRKFHPEVVFLKVLHPEVMFRQEIIPKVLAMELDRRGAELLFQVLTEREEKNSIAIASNESFSGWTKTFTDPRLCAAIVDRLTFNGTIIETGTDSYRLAHTRAQRSAS
ncbi:hypothetical protein GCM10027403_23070 [Arthrobacter tecti]